VLLKCIDHAIKLAERGLHTPSQCNVTLTDDVWCRAFIVSKCAARDFFIDIILFEAIHEDIDVPGKVRQGQHVDFLVLNPEYRAPQLRVVEDFRCKVISLLAIPMMRHCHAPGSSSV
jgi:hypothetical protein